MSATIKDAQLTLDVLCSKVKLGRDKFPVVEAAIAVPKDACLWTGEYACLLLWPLVGQTSESIKESVNQAQDYFDEILIAKEGASASYDGYLVLALESQPIGEMDVILREFELSTSVCRKNAIWPVLGNTKESGWSRIADVTVLGLPEMSVVSEERLSWPVVDEDVRRLWQEINTTAHFYADIDVGKCRER